MKSVSVVYSTERSFAQVLGVCWSTSDTLHRNTGLCLSHSAVCCVSVMHTGGVLPLVCIHAADKLRDVGNPTLLSFVPAPTQQLTCAFNTNMFVCHVTAMRVLLKSQKEKQS